MGTEVHVDDLEELWTAGKVNLQQVATQYSQAASQLHKTGLSQESAFSGATEELGSAWSKLRNLVQDDVLVRSYSNCTRSGNALAHIAIAISEQDGNNKADLEERIADIENSPVADDRPPPPAPEAPSHDDEHPSENRRSPGKPLLPTTDPFNPRKAQRT